MVNPSVVNEVRRFLKTVNEHGIQVSFGVVFGSHSRGEATGESDIDLLVVSPVFDGIKERTDVGELWHCAAEIDSLIEPIPCGERQWIEDEGSPIIEVARQEGQIVKLA